MDHSSDVQHAPIAELLPDLDRLAADSMADWKVPGAALAVVQDGEVVLAKGLQLELGPQILCSGMVTITLLGAS